MKINAPLYNKLIEYANTQYPMHMSGHKLGNTNIFEIQNLLKLDATEATGLDNLYDAQEVIYQAQYLMSKFYGSKKTIFLTNGSTAGIIASILALCKPKDKILVSRNCHYSVWNAMVLADIIPIYITPEYYNSEILGKVTVCEIQKAIEKFPDIKGLIMVSPTYEGITSNIEAISKILKSKNKFLIVDEAHGSHFGLSDKFPISSTYLGADIVIHSMHKTLPTLTQSALLHICNNIIDEKIILKNLKLFQTSSPSYLLMGIMDFVRSYIQENKDLIYKNYIIPLIEIRLNLTKLKKLLLIDEKISNYDMGKIIILTYKCSISGYELGEILEKDYNIGVEAMFINHIILISTFVDSVDILRKLENALFEIDSKITHQTKLYSNPIISSDIKEGYSPRDIYYSEHIWEIIDEAVGKISAQNIMFYPPGIPLICIGETISDEHIQIIKQHHNNLQGIQVIDGKLKLLVAYLI